jgi:hypothetical protein
MQMDPPRFRLDDGADLSDVSVFCDGILIWTDPGPMFR